MCVCVNSWFCRFEFYFSFSSFFLFPFSLTLSHACLLSTTLVEKLRLIILSFVYNIFYFISSVFCRFWFGYARWVIQEVLESFFTPQKPINEFSAECFFFLLWQRVNFFHGIKFMTHSQNFKSTEVRIRSSSFIHTFISTEEEHFFPPQNKMLECKKRAKFCLTHTHTHTTPRNKIIS